MIIFAFCLVRDGCTEVPEGFGVFGAALMCLFFLSQISTSMRRI